MNVSSYDLRISGKGFGCCTSIRHKLALVIISLTAVTLLLSGVLIVYSKTLAFRKQVAKDLLSIAGVVANNSQAAVAFSDQEDALLVLGSLAGSPAVVYAHVEDAAGSILAAYRTAAFAGEPLLSKATSHVLHKGGWFTLRLPIMLKGAQIGSVFVQADSRDVNRFRQQTVFVVSLSLLVVLLMAMGLSYGVQKIIADPIERLTDRVREVCATKDYSLRAPDMGGDEIGVLAHVFNDMLYELELRDTKLQERENRLRRIADELSGKEHELQRAEGQLQKLGSAVEQSASTVVITDLAGRIEYTNPAFEAHSGYTREEALGQNPRILKSGETPGHVYEELWQTIICGGEWHGELHNKRKDGTLFWESARISPIRDAAGRITHFLAIKEDITGRKHAEQQLLEANRELAVATEKANAWAKQAEKANMAKSEFLANMSHEIRTPMNGVIGMIELLLDTPLDDTQRRFAQTVKSSAQALLTVINDILDFSKIEARKLVLESIDFRMHDLLEDVCMIMRSKADQKGVAFAYHADATVPEVISGDPVRLRQILVNLIGNAVKFTEAGTVRLQVGYRKSTGHLRIAVSDTGIGIPRDRRDLLFKQFSQVDSSVTRKHGGTGLGLAISKQLVEMMGGRIRVYSRTGQGSTFWFRVPVKIVSTLSGMKTTETDTRFLLNMFAERNVQLLLAEDDSTNQAVALAILRKLGLSRVDVAASGMQALEAISARHYDLILMDVQMPEMDGLEATRRIRQQTAGYRQQTTDSRLQTADYRLQTADYRLENEDSSDAGSLASAVSRVPIIAMTAHAMQGDREKCLEAGMDDYISKPIEVKKLADALMRYLPR
jgi:PAS domain S-box-containing protein